MEKNPIEDNRTSFSEDHSEFIETENREPVCTLPYGTEKLI